MIKWINCIFNQFYLCLLLLTSFPEVDLVELEASLVETEAYLAKAGTSFEETEAYLAKTGTAYSALNKC